MEAHAAAMQPAGRSVLNVGFGLGLIDRCLQSRRPKAHHIVECHPDVLAAMQQEGWTSKPGVRILQGRWQDVLPGDATYDAIFWDTFGESVDELFEFMALLPTLLNPGGTFSYFNGIASHDEFLHRVYGDAARQRPTIESFSQPDNRNPGVDNPGVDNPGADNPGADNPGVDNRESDDDQSGRPT